MNNMLQMCSPATQASERVDVPPSTWEKRPA